MIYGIRLLDILRSMKSIETHLVLSAGAVKNIQLETDYSPEAVLSMADSYYEPDDMAASISSGSFQTEGMVVIPCSVKTLSGIANSYNDNLLTRAADVSLKEGRKLVIVPRETPWHKGHLELMSRVVDYGATLIPPIPAFYHKPKTIMDIVDQTLGKILDQFRIEHQLFERWSSR